MNDRLHDLLAAIIRLAVLLALLGTIGLGLAELIFDAADTLTDSLS